MPEGSARCWVKGSLADRPLHRGDIWERAHTVAAAIGALTALNDVFQEMKMPAQANLIDAIHKAFECDLLTRKESQNLLGLNQEANTAKHSF